MSRRIVVYTSPACGHLFPIVDVALELRRRGHLVEVHALASQCDNLRREGLRAVPLAPQIEANPLVDYRASTALGGLKSIVRTFVQRAPIEAISLQQACARFRPDALLVDISCTGAAAWAEGQAMPFATYSPHLPVIPSSEVPAFGLGASFATGTLGRLRDKLSWALAHRAVSDSTAPLNQIRAQLGARPLEHAANYGLASPRLLVRVAESFDYPREHWPASVQFTGPGLWCPKATGSTPLPSSNRPLVLVTASTELQRDRGLLHTALQLSNDPQFDLLLTSAAHPPEAVRTHAQAAGRHAPVHQFAAHADIVPYASAVVCHGGMGITQRALSSGCPVVIVPHGRDQREVARRVLRAGVGCVVPAAKLTAARLRRSILQAMDTAKPAAQRVAEAWRDLDSTRTTTDTFLQAVHSSTDLAAAGARPHEMH